MNIDGHEVERRGVGIYIDGKYSGWSGNFEAGVYEQEADSLRARAVGAERVAEFVRREAAEKAAQDAADELDRRAALACEARFGDGTWHTMGSHNTESWRNVVRALDADAAAREA